MNLDQLQTSVLQKPGMYFGSLDSRGIRELIFWPLWTLSKNTEELQINLFISIFKKGILIKIIDNNKVLSPIFRNLKCDVNGSIGLFAALVPIKHAVINHDNNKLFRFEKLDELKSFQYQFEHINALEYFIDFSFFTELIEKNKLFFELKGKAQTFAAINHKCKVTLEDKSLSTVYEIFYPKGLSDFLREIDHDRIIVSHGKLISIHYQNSIERFTLSLRECYTGPKTILSYVNGHNTIEGGTHVNALKKSINKLSKKIMYLDSNSYNGKKTLMLRFTSYTAVLSLFMDNCKYRGAVKEYLLSDEAFDLVVEGFEKNIDTILEQLR